MEHVKHTISNWRFTIFFGFHRERHETSFFPVWTELTTFENIVLTIPTCIKPIKNRIPEKENRKRRIDLSHMVNGWTCFNAKTLCLNEYYLAEEKWNEGEQTERTEQKKPRWTHSGLTKKKNNCLFGRCGNCEYITIFSLCNSRFGRKRAGESTIWSNGKFCDPWSITSCCCCWSCDPNEQ